MNWDDAIVLNAQHRALGELGMSENDIFMQGMV